MALIEEIVSGTAKHDTLTLEDGERYKVYAYEGNDTITGANKNDTFICGTGNDIIQIKADSFFGDDKVELEDDDNITVDFQNMQSYSELSYEISRKDVVVTAYTYDTVDYRKITSESVTSETLTKNSDDTYSFITNGIVAKMVSEGTFGDSEEYTGEQLTREFENTYQYHKNYNADTQQEITQNTDFEDKSDDGYVYEFGAKQYSYNGSDPDDEGKYTLTVKTGEWKDSYYSYGGAEEVQLTLDQMKEYKLVGDETPSKFTNKVSYSRKLTTPDEITYEYKTDTDFVHSDTEITVEYERYTTGINSDDLAITDNNVNLYKKTGTWDGDSNEYVDGVWVSTGTTKNLLEADTVERQTTIQLEENDWEVYDSSQGYDDFGIITDYQVTLGTVTFKDYLKYGDSSNINVKRDSNTVDLKTHLYDVDGSKGYIGATWLNENVTAENAKYGITINTGLGDDKIKGSVYNDVLTGGYGDNKLIVDLSAPFGDDKVNLTGTTKDIEPENLKINFENSTASIVITRELSGNNIILTATDSENSVEYRNIVSTSAISSTVLESLGNNQYSFISTSSVKDMVERGKFGTAYEDDNTKRIITVEDEITYYKNYSETSKSGITQDTDFEDKSDNGYTYTFGAKKYTYDGSEAVDDKYTVKVKEGVWNGSSYTYGDETEEQLTLAQMIEYKLVSDTTETPSAFTNKVSYSRMLTIPEGETTCTYASSDFTHSLSTITVEYKKYLDGINSADLNITDDKYNIYRKTSDWDGSEYGEYSDWENYKTVDIIKTYGTAIERQEKTNGVLGDWIATDNTQYNDFQPDGFLGTITILNYVKENVTVDVSYTVDGINDINLAELSYSVDENDFNGSTYVGTKLKENIDASNLSGSAKIFAGGADDTITGSKYDDIIVGGVGSNTVEIDNTKTFGNDVYKFTLGEDALTLSFTDNTNIDYSISSDLQDVIVQTDNGTVLLENYAQKDCPDVLVNPQNLNQNLNDYIFETDITTNYKGTRLKEEINASNAEKGLKIYAGTNENTIIGSQHNDTILASLGENTYTIDTTKTNGDDIIELKTGEEFILDSSSDLTFEISGNDVIADYNNGSITFKNFVKNGANYDVTVNSNVDLNDYSFIREFETSDFQKTNKFTGTRLNEKIDMSEVDKKSKGKGVGLSINAGDGNDTIIGTQYKDTIQAGAGDDSIYAGANDVITGGAGENTISVDISQTSYSTVNLTKGEVLTVVVKDGTTEKEAKYFVEGKNLCVYYDTVSTPLLKIMNYVGKDTGAQVILNGNNLSEISQKTYDEDNVVKSKLTGTSLAETFTLTDYESTSNKGVNISSGAGNDIITGSSYNDTITTGVGNNTITENGGTNKITTSKGNDTITIDGSSSNTVKAGDGNNSIIVYSAGKNKVTTGVGNDTINVSAGLNTISSGKGDDIISVLGGINTIDLSSGNDSITISSGENTIKSSGEATIEVKDLSVNTFNVSGDNDFTINANSTNTIKAGKGSNTYNIILGTNTITAKSGTNDLTISGGTNIVKFGKYNDTVSVTGGDNDIYADAGNDIITVDYSSKSQQDLYLNGGTGNDIYDLSSANLSDNYIKIEDSKGSDTIILDNINDYLAEFNVSIKKDKQGNLKSYSIGSDLTLSKNLSNDEGIDIVKGVNSKGVCIIEEFCAGDDSYTIDSVAIKGIASEIAAWLVNTGYTSVDALMTQGTETEQKELIAAFNSANSNYNIFV